jgi:uncharacterized membrane protein YgcG
MANHNPLGAPPKNLVGAYRAFISHVKYAIPDPAAPITEQTMNMMAQMLNDAAPSTDIDKVTVAVLRNLYNLDKKKFSFLVEGTYMEPYMMWIGIGRVLFKLGLLGRVDVSRSDGKYAVRAKGAHEAPVRVQVDPKSLHDQIMAKSNGHGNGNVRGRGRGRGGGGFRGRGGRGRGGARAPLQVQNTFDALEPTVGPEPEPEQEPDPTADAEVPVVDEDDDGGVMDDGGSDEEPIETK